MPSHIYVYNINAFSPNGEPSGQHEENKLRDETNIVRKTELKESQTSDMHPLNMSLTRGIATYYLGLDFQLGSQLSLFITK